MIAIQQDLKVDRLSNSLIKIGSTDINFNIQTILYDIYRLEKGLEGIKDREDYRSNVNSQNITAIIKYLRSILKRAKRGVVEVKWVVDNGTIKSYPIEMKDIPEYGILTTDYIDINKGKLLHLDYSELSDIIAFEMMYRDLGETNRTIEEKLDQIGIVAVNESKELTKHFTGSPYKASKVLPVEKSPYLTPDNNKILDYFGVCEFDADTYKKAVSYSCRYAMAIILESMIKENAILANKIKICGVFDTSIYLLMDENMKDRLTDSICVRAFGRKFEVVPKAQIF